MKFLVLLSLLLLPSAAFAEEARICYFSLNEAAEFTATRDFLKQVNAYSPKKIVIKEFLKPGENPETAFQRMVEKSGRCDGLVITGHHYGEWQGKRADGKLGLDFLEKLSCNPMYEDWFRNIKATWLQGCRTLGVGEIAADDPQANADFHTNRVAQDMEPDSIEGSIADLNMQFSNTMDEDNPLASRYRRLFPEATVFGWTRSAPGTNVKSWKSMLFHMAQAARVTDEEGQFPASDPTGIIAAQDAATYSNAVLFTLKQLNGSQSRECEDVSVSAWLAQGNVGRPGKYYFDNPDLRAYPSLSSTGDHTLKQAREIDCLLKNAIKHKNIPELEMTLDLITSNPDYLRYSLNNLIDIRNTLLAEGKTKMPRLILERMAKIPGIRSLIDAKLSSPRVGVTRKIDYYRFFRDLTGETRADVEQNISAVIVKELSAPLPPVTNPPTTSRKIAARYRAELFQSLVKNKIAGPNFYYDLLAVNPEPDVLYTMVKHATIFDRENAVDWMRLAAQHKNADKQMLEAVERAAETMKLSRKNTQALLREFSYLANKTYVPMKTYTLPDGSSQQLPESGGGLY